MVQATVALLVRVNPISTGERAFNTEDEAKLSILNNLSECEVWGKYTWTDFQAMGHDFANMMRLRRALVSDLYTGLRKTKQIRLKADLDLVDKDGEVSFAGKDWYAWYPHFQ